MENAYRAPTFETPYDVNFPRVLTAIGMAHARGLKVMVVPHLWVESGEWRAQIDPPTGKCLRRRGVRHQDHRAPAAQVEFHRAPR